MKKNWIVGIFLAIVAALFSSCNNDITNIGLGLNTELLGTDFTDTCTLTAYSFFEDTINTTKLSANLIGSVTDPVFGETQATTYAQFDLTGSSVNFGEAPVIDSIVLTLQLASFFGDTTNGVAIRVYELDESFDTSATYYNNSTLVRKSSTLNYQNENYIIHPNTAVVVDTGAYSPHLRIRLKNSFGQYLLNNSDHMYSNNSFKDFFKGLCLTAESHTGQTGYVMITNLTSSLSGITLYYHNGSKRSKNSAKYTFSCNNNCVRFTNFQHNYNTSTDASFLQEVIAGDHSVGTQKLFFQAGSGVKTKVSFPHLRNAFKCYDNRVVINRAELVITDLNPDEKNLTHPAALTLQAIKKDGSGITFVPDDESYTSATYYGGYYDATKHEYRFRVTQYVQQLISDNSSQFSDELYVVVKGSAVRANRLVAGGTGLDNDHRIRLELAYTPY